MALFMQIMKMTLTQFLDHFLAKISFIFFSQRILKLVTAICGWTLPFLGGDQPFMGTPAFAQEGTKPLKENAPPKIDDHHP